MLTWLLKKRGGAAPIASATPVSSAPRVPSASTKPGGPRSAERAPTRQAGEEAKALWAPRLAAALGDDAALLQLAQAAPLLDIKLAAVEALGSEAALKQAERDFRSHDRRVHRVAKRRFETAVTQREARVRADTLIETAAALTGVDVVPANTLVTLDHDWNALPVDLLEPSQRSRFAALRERLNTALRERGEQQLALERAKADAARVPPPVDEPEADAPQAAPAVVIAATVVDDAAAETSEASVTPATFLAPRPKRSKASSAELLQRLEARVQQAEAAVADGQSAALQQHLKAIDAVCATLGDQALPGPLLTRLHAVQNEGARLRGWQQWGGARARDELTAQAEALARVTLAAAQPQAAKLALKAHGDAIHTLRQRWKELDRTGAAAPQPLWQRFDAALQIANQPLAEQQAALKAARADNLKAREALLEVLDAWPDAVAADVATPSLKDRLRALDRFHTAWRQLGPLEHTVPAAARAALQRRLDQTVERVEAPLLEARRAAQAEREQLVARAEALAQALAAQPPSRDAALRVRELQAEWQQHARSLPLARGAEAALWSRFKAATDAVFAQRDAAFSARDAEWAAHLAEREALLQRLSAVDADTPEADIRRTLDEVDRAWRQAGEVPRNAVAGLEARLREAHAAALQHLAGGAQKRWHTQCDALLARLVLCEAREQAGAVDAVGDADEARDATWVARWTALESGAPALPAPWQQALARRWEEAMSTTASTGTSAGVAPAGPAFDAWMLQLEAAFELPTAPEYQAARREWKLRALKDALEARRAPESGPERRDAVLASVLGQAGLTPPQRDRLRAFFAAWRAGPAGHAGTLR